MLVQLPVARELVGIARRAAESQLLESKRRVEYRQLVTRRWITRTSGRNLPFQWTVNPYRGCEYGCKYCYALYTHEFMELDPAEEFEQKIFVKNFHSDGFRRELASVPRPEALAIGTATDPYQPAERRFQITRRILAVLAEDSGREVGMATKSDLVVRDIDLLATLARRNALTVCITITTLEEALARMLEPYAPRPELRLQAVARLAGAGLRVHVLCSPILPGLNDSEESLAAVARAARTAGAVSMSGRVVFLKECAQKTLYPFLEGRFPQLAAQYRHLFARGAFLRGEYTRLIGERLERVRRQWGLDERRAPPPPEPGPQLDLFSVDRS